MQINESVINLINHVLKTNTGALYKLQKHASCTWSIQTGIVSLHGVICANGELAPIDKEATDCIIQIPSSIIPSLITGDKILIFKQIKIIGNNELAKVLLEILSELHFDGVIYKSQNQLDNLIVYQLTNLLAHIRDYIKLITSNASTSIHDYLIYENKTLTNPYEVEQFCQDTAELHNDVERLSQSIKLYLSQK